MNILVLLVVLPLLAAFLLPLAGRSQAANDHSQHGMLTHLIPPAVFIFNLTIAVALWYGNQEVGPQTLAVGGFTAPIGIVFYADALALLFVMALSFITLVLWLGKERHELRQEVLWLLLTGAGCGMLLSGDLFNIYVFFEIAAVASYGLAAQTHTAGAYAASFRFLVLGSVGSMLIFFGIGLIYAITGTLNLSHLAMLAPTMLHNALGLSAFVMILIGLAVKAELFPMNTWAPEVYAHASPRVSAMLAGVVSKLAIVVAVRLLLLLFPGVSEAQHFLLLLGVLSVITGETAAFRAVTLRQMLAFSSIGQLGLVAIAFAIPGPAGVMAGIALALHHMLVKTALFMLAGPWGGFIADLRGMARLAPGSVLLFTLLVLSLLGIPPLPGFWAKFLLLKAALAANDPWLHFAMFIVLAATVVETAYFIRVWRAMLSGPASERAYVPSTRTLKPVIVIAISLLLIIPLIGPISELLKQTAVTAADAKLYIHYSFPAWQQ